ncbi:MAG: LemA family protein [Firmicutes bacterium]|nr:LemA family protein [Bacillota bacterium]
MLLGIILISIAVILVIWGIGMYNGFIRMKNRIEEAFATMDVYLKKRYDLIPNLVETVKGYAAHESGTLSAVIQARNIASGANTIEGRIEGETMLNGALKNLFAVAEAYPDLKANANFLDLQAQLRSMEDEIAQSRKYYNAVVKEFNTKTEAFPSNLIAGIFHFERRKLFEVNEEAEREAVPVHF